MLLSTKSRQFEEFWTKITKVIRVHKMHLHACSFCVMQEMSTMILLKNSCYNYRIPKVTKFGGILNLVILVFLFFC